MFRRLQSVSAQYLCNQTNETRCSEAMGSILRHRPSNGALFNWSEQLASLYFYLIASVSFYFVEENAEYISVDFFAEDEKINKFLYVLSLCFSSLSFPFNFFGCSKKKCTKIVFFLLKNKQNIKSKWFFVVEQNFIVVLFVFGWGGNNCGVRICFLPNPRANTCPKWKLAKLS